MSNNYKISSIDFEFHSSNEEHPTLVCAALDNETYWLFDFTEKARLKRDLLEKKDHIFLSYYTVAEARCFIALGLNPMDFQWIDLYAEFRMLQNSNDKFNYGSYISRSGEKAFSTPPIIDTDTNEDEDTNNSKVPSNLINAVYKLLGERLDSEHKDKMRDIILTKDEELILQNKESIMNYCLSDIKYLYPLYEAITKELIDELPFNKVNIKKHVLSRGVYSAATAMSEQLGIPIDIDFLKQVEDKTPIILYNERNEFNSNHFKLFTEEYTPPPKHFKNGKIHYYKTVPATKNSNAYQEYIEQLNIKDYPKTDTGKYKATKEVLEIYRHIPALEDLFKYKKLEDSLKWFNGKNARGFHSALGNDNCVRPFYGVYGTQTSRNAAKATTFPLAMSHWLRILVKPNPDEYIIGCDFSQQEIYIAAVLSEDDNLLNAYNAGDVYLAFGKQAGLIPKDGTKSTHKKERQMCKATVLGLQFGMGLDKLRHKLSFELKEEISIEKTQELINAHKETYFKYWQYVYNIRNRYKHGELLTLIDGWTLFKDNPRITSVSNFPIQGTAAAITRHAIVELWKKNVKVMCGLHDAIYSRTTNPERDLPLIESQMKESTRLLLEENKTNIKIDSKIYSHNDLFLEEKGEEDWNRLKKFFTEKD